MAEVKRRKPQEEVEEPTPKELVLKIAGKKYKLPDLEYDHYLELMQLSKEAPPVADESNAFEKEIEGMKFVRSYYWNLLHPYYPDLKEEDLGKMPVYQFTPIFMTKVMIALLSPPLD